MECIQMDAPVPVVRLRRTDPTAECSVGLYA